MRLCPECGELMTPADSEGSFPECVDGCGYVEYDPRTLAIMAETRREVQHAKGVLGYVPSYRVALERGLAS